MFLVTRRLSRGSLLVGSFAAGLFSWYVLHRHGAGLLLSVLFAMAILFVLRRTVDRR